MTKKEFHRAFLDTVPVMTGYLFLGFGFGLLMQQKGFGGLWSGAMSLFIYAGSMQYVAVNLITGGAGLLTTALTTLTVWPVRALTRLDLPTLRRPKKPICTRSAEETELRLIFSPALIRI